MQISDEIILHGNWEAICLEKNEAYITKGLKPCDKFSVLNVPLNEVLTIKEIHSDGDIWIDHPKASGCMHKECFVLLNKDRRKLND